MGESKIKNAVIRSTSLEIEDHNILTCWLYLDYGGSGQGFGGYGLGLSGNNKHRDDQKESVFCARFLRGILDVAGVRRWDALDGKTIRVEADMGHIYRIGHIVEDIWLDPKELHHKVFPEKATAP